MSDPFEIYEVPFKVLKFMGLSKVETNNPRVRFVYAIYRTYSFVFLWIFFAFCCADLYIHLHNIQKVSFNLTITASTSLILWKTAKFLQYNHIIKSLKDEIRAGLHEEPDEEDRGLLMESIGEIRRACSFVYAMIVLSMTVWTVTPLCFPYHNGERRFPWPLYMPWPHDRTPFYEITYIYHTYSSFYLVFSVFSISLTFFELVIGILAEYNILIKNVRGINKFYEGLPSGSEHVFSDEENKTVGEMIRGVVQHHQKIIQAVNKLESCYNEMFLVQFVLGSITLSVLAFKLALAKGAFHLRLLHILFLFSTVANAFFLFCSFGNRIFCKNEEFFNTLYELPWEAMNTRNRKSVYIIMLRLGKPVRLTIHKIATLNFCTILKISKAIYNLLYLMLHLAEKKNSEKVN